MTTESLIRYPTGYPTTQDKVYRVGETMRLGTVVSNYNEKTMKWEPVAICR